MPDARLLASAAALIGVGAAGLGVPAPTPKAPKAATKLAFDTPDPSWPDQLLRWLDVAYRGLVPRAETAVFTGSGRIRLGRSPWLPVSFQTSHRLGFDFAAELNATWYGRPVVRAVDGYLNGHGVSAVRGQTTTGAGLNQGAVPFLWSEAILIPSTWNLGGLDFQSVSDTQLSLTIPKDALVASPLTATVTFDDETGLPNRFEVPWRAKDPDGTTGAGWWVDYEGWERTGHGLRPRQISVNWADDPRPWLRLRLTPPALNVSVAEALARIHALIDGAKATAPHH